MLKALQACFLLLALVAAAPLDDKVVEITSEPSHHLAFQNEWVRVFNVMAPAKASTLIHRHNYDYLYVTLGDTDITNARVGEAQVQVTLKDGEVRFTNGGFAHAVINNSEHPFHNITIELLGPSSGVHPCTESCDLPVSCASADKTTCASARKVLESDQWTAVAVTIPPSGTTGEHTHAGPHLGIAVSELNLKQTSKDRPDAALHMGVGDITWVDPVSHSITNVGRQPARLVDLEFKVPVPQKHP